MLPNSSRVLRISDLPTRVSESEIVACFSPGGNLININIVRVSEDSPDCAGYGYLYFSTASDAVTAMGKYQNEPIRGTSKLFRLSYVPEFQESPVDEFQVYVGQLPLSTTDQELYELFHADSSHVVNVRIMRGAGNISRGFGFVQYDKPEFAYKSVSRMQKATLNGSKLLVRETYQRSRIEIERGIDCINNASVFVGNLNLSIGDLELSKSFEKFGTVIACKVVANRGFGFLTFSDHVAALAALSGMQNMELFGQRIHLAWGRDTQQHQFEGEAEVKSVAEDTSAEFHASMMPMHPSKKHKTSIPHANVLEQTLKLIRQDEVKGKSIDQINEEYIEKRLMELIYEQRDL